MKYAPVIIPTLCRSEHFIRLIESLKKNSWATCTEVYVGLDFPPSDRYRKGWKEICQYIDNSDFSCFAAFHVIRHKVNVGAAKNIESLRKEIWKSFDRYICLEDDNEVSPNFLEYMDKCLQEFEDDLRVVFVSGYSYPVNWDVSEGSTCFKQNFVASAWGIGYWVEKEKKMLDFIEDGRLLKSIDKVVENKLDVKMIDAALMDYIPNTLSPFKKITKWMRIGADISYRVYLAVEDKYCVTPVISKVRNYGFDGSGLYCQTIDSETADNLTAGTYNYSSQPIDRDLTFEFNMDIKDSMDVNRELLNKFDYRTDEQMAPSRTLLKMMNRYGITFSRFYYIMFMLPKIVFELICTKFSKK